MVALCQFARNEQAEPGPVAPAGKKRFENPVEVGVVDSVALVSDLEKRSAAARHASGAQLDAVRSAVRAAILQSVLAGWT